MTSTSAAAPISLPSHMRAAQWTSVPIESSLKVNRNVPLPKAATQLPKNAALVKIAYASLNPVDYKVSEVAFARLLALGKGPWTPACDYAGTVVYSTLSHVSSGDRVCGTLALPRFGTLAEYVVVTGTDSVYKVPDGMSLQDASTLGVAAQTALQSLAPFMRHDAKVIINGASGGTGTFGVQIAKLLGGHVTAICSGKNAELCKQLGADRVIDYHAQDVVKELSNGGLQYDLIVNNVAVGGPICTFSHRYLKKGGQYATIAFAPGLGSVVTAFQLLVLPAWLGGALRKSQIVICKNNSPDFEKLAAWQIQGKLRPHIDKVYSLNDAAEAYKVMKSGRARGKLVVQI